MNRQTVYTWTKRLNEKKIRARMPDKLDLEALKGNIEDYPDVRISMNASNALV